MTKGNLKKILAIETSCDETAAAVTEGTRVLSSVKWTQQIHAKWGGVVPNLAKRAHEERIDAIINRSMSNIQYSMSDIDAIAVTAGPGLAVALEVGIKKAKELAEKYNMPLIAVNHIEGHVLSPLVSTANSKTEIRSSPTKNPGGFLRVNKQIQNYKFKIPNIKFPALALVVSGGHTQIIQVNNIGDYQILAESLDDDIGEAIDKGARMLGLPYPGGPALELAAREGNAKKYILPLPMAGREGTGFSYSGLKTAFYRLVNSLSTSLSEQEKKDLAASYQEMVFRHLLRTIKIKYQESSIKYQDLLVGGGVAANEYLRGKLDELGGELGIRVHYPESKVLCTDNAAMIGVVGGFKLSRGETEKIESIDREPKAKVDHEFSFKS